jgi:hypothetical protein
VSQDERLGDTIDYVSQYKCSARARQVLSVGMSYVDDPMVDWALYGEYAYEYHLDSAKDNKSVWDPRWLVFGLARFGDTIPTTLAERFWQWSTERLERPSEQTELTENGSKILEGQFRRERRASSTQDTPEQAVPQGRRAAIDWLTETERSLNQSTSTKRSRSELGVSFRSDGRVHLADPVHLDGGILRDGPRRSHVYEEAYNAALRVAGNRSRRHEVASIDYVVDEVLHSSKSAGAPYFRSVGDSVQDGIIRACRIWHLGRAFDPHVAYRRIQHGPLAPKGRLVWGSPLATTILASTFAKPAYEGLRRKRSFAYGRRKSVQGAVVSELQSRFRRVYSIDFSGFDASVPAFIIADAFKILKTYLCFKDDEEELLDRLIHDFIHTRIVLPDCSMWQKHRGIPSGSPFTSMIGSLCNLIVLNYMWISITGRALDESQVMILGDDSVVGTNSQPSKAELARAAADLGMTVSESKSHVATLGTRVHFLGHWWQNGMPRRDERDVVIHVVYEEWHRPQDHARRMMRMYGYTSESLDAYRIIASKISEGKTHLPLEVHLIALANKARESEVSLWVSGPGRLRYLEAHEPELLPGDAYKNAKLAGPVGLGS